MWLSRHWPHTGKLRHIVTIRIRCAATARRTQQQSGEFENDCRKSVEEPEAAMDLAACAAASHRASDFFRDASTATATRKSTGIADKLEASKCASMLRSGGRETTTVCCARHSEEASGGKNSGDRDPDCSFMILRRRDDANFPQFYAASNLSSNFGARLPSPTSQRARTAAPSVKPLHSFCIRLRLRRRRCMIGWMGLWFCMLIGFLSQCCALRIDDAGVKIVKKIDSTLYDETPKRLKLPQSPPPLAREFRPGRRPKPNIQPKPNR